MHTSCSPCQRNALSCRPTPRASGDACCALATSPRPRSGAHTAVASAACGRTMMRFKLTSRDGLRQCLCLCLLVLHHPSPCVCPAAGRDAHAGWDTSSRAGADVLGRSAAHGTQKKDTNTRSFQRAGAYAAQQPLDSEGMRTLRKPVLIRQARRWICAVRIIVAQGGRHAAEGHQHAALQQCINQDNYHAHAWQIFAAVY